MNTVLLNTVHLDCAPIIKKVSGEGGGSTILNQSKSVEITENGSVSVTPDAGYTGLSKVDVNVDVPTQEINNQDKAIDIVENGTTEIVADSGYTGLGKVSVNVNVPSSGGGSVVSVPRNAVNFFDYDGTVLHSYTKEEFLALSAMPELPTREGLICQEWNWDFADAQSYVSEYGVLDVGATYITDDGKTRLYIELTADDMTIPLYWYQSEPYGVRVDWGDGSDSETFSTVGYQLPNHTYSKKGNYCITFYVISGFIRLHNKTPFNNKAQYECILRKIELGEGISQLPKCLSYRGLSSITIPKSVTVTGNNTFESCYSLKSIVFPRSLNSIGGALFKYCYTLRETIMPYGIVSIGEDFFKNCYNLRSIVIPNTMTSIVGGGFYLCNSLTSVLVPNSVSSINNSAFYSCTLMKFYDFSFHKAVPTLAATDAFYGIPSDCKIIVPDVLYDEWIAATNWSSIASNIIKKSDWDASQA